VKFFYGGGGADIRDDYGRQTTYFQNDSGSFSDKTEEVPFHKVQGNP
jgi:hypothetical protein